MKYLLALTACFYICLGSMAQNVTKSYPKTLALTSDTVYYKWNFINRIFSADLSKRDTVNTGTDGAIGLSGTIYYGKDSLMVPYTALPNQQILYITFVLPKGKKTVFEFRYNGVVSAFPPDYIAKNKRNVQFDIPEVYELANIIWNLSPSGKRPTDLYKQGPYYERMMAYFKPYLNHQIFKQLDFPDSSYYNNYYEFRENSFMYQFDAKGKLVNKGPYYYVYGDEEKTDLFTRLLPLIQDFAKKSNFASFYKQNQAFYNQETEREAQLMPIKNMWQWLEQQFPKRKYQSYRIVFSPLVGGSHSTQNYSTYNQDGSFAETVMFICATDRYEKPEWTEKQKEGLMSGVVFTEIDHNYVNPVSNRFAKAIDSVFSNRTYWANKVKSYRSSVAVFNEYMTHAVFCLWVMDTYDAATAKVVIDLREDMMVNKRKFSKFKEFNQALLKMHSDNKTATVQDLYPAVLAWSRLQK